jgi:CheY-like chemotaxis protein
MAGIGVSDGSRVAVIGAGPSGGAFACGLLASARAFGRRVELTLYDGTTQRQVRPPALLEADSRHRLASLGAPICLRQGAIDVQGVLVWAAGRSALLEPPPGGLWILDGPIPGARAVKDLLLSAAKLRGARVETRRAESIERADDRVVVRAHGRADTYDLVAGAFGAHSPLAPRWSSFYAPPPLLRGAHARVTWSGRDELLRLCFAPTPQVDLLALVPCGASAYVRAVGPDASERALASALLVLGRDRALPSGLSIVAVERAPLPAGAARTPRGERELVVGAAAVGGPADPGLAGALLGALRASRSVLEPDTVAPLCARLSRAQADLGTHARRQARILRWARRAGGRLPEALARLAGEGGAANASLCLFGIPSLGASRVLSRLRLEAVKQTIEGLFAPMPLPEPAPPAERALVYVVDDDADQRELLAEVLRLRGARVRAFADETTLLEAAASERPGAILLDIVLTWVDGRSLCRALRAHPATARTRLLAMSNLDRKADRDAALAAGADAFLPKPVDPGTLESLLGDLELGGEARPLGAPLSRVKGL